MGKQWNQCLTLFWGKVRLVKAMVFPLVMYGCESWTVKKDECQRIDAFELWLEKTLESPLDCKEIQPVHPKGDQSWVFTGRSYGKAETSILWPPHVKCWLIGKDPDAEKDWGQEEKGISDDEMAGWYHLLDGHEFEWTLGVGDGERPGVLQFMGLQRVRHDWVTELNWKSLQMVAVTRKLKTFTLWKESYDQPRQHIKKQRHCQQRLWFFQ